MATASGDKTACLISITELKTIFKVKHLATVCSVFISTDSKYIATASWDKTARLTRISDGQTICTIQHNAEVYCVFISANSQ